MRLEIEYKKDIINKHFGNWLINIISNMIKSNLDERKLVKLDEYIAENFHHIFKKPITCKDIIYSSVKELVCEDDSSKLIIKISNNKFMQGLDRVRIETLCRLINYGNTDIKGYPIFTQTFNYIADNISLYIMKYLEEIK